MEEKNLILIVEDDRDIASAITDRLNSENFETINAYDGETALKLALQFRPDLILLDEMLPHKNGSEIMDELRGKIDSTVLMLTARDDESDVLAGFAHGVDDYMTKPFSMRELLARVNALLRRPAPRPPHTSNEIKIGDFTLDSAKKMVYLNGDYLRLTMHEFKVFELLSQNSNEIVSRGDLLKDVWNWENAEGETRTVDTHIKTLRQKIGKQYIETARGYGYIFRPNGN